MNRFSARVLLLILPASLGYPVWAQSSLPRVEVAKARNASSSAKIAPVSKQQLFGSIPISTRSQEARKFVELSLDKYENHIVDGALSNARRAIQKDPQFALGYAALSLASLGSIPDSAKGSEGEGGVTEGKLRILLDSTAGIAEGAVHDVVFILVQRELDEFAGFLRAR